MIGTAQHWSETMNALIAVIFVLLDTGMEQDAAIFLWAVLATVEWLANRYAGWLFKRAVLATPGDCGGLASIVIQAPRHRCACSRCGISQSPDDRASKPSLGDHEATDQGAFGLRDSAADQ